MIEFAQVNALQLTIITSVLALGLRYLIFYRDIDEAFELRVTYIEERKMFAEGRSSASLAAVAASVNAAKVPDQVLVNTSTSTWNCNCK